MCEKKKLLLNVLLTPNIKNSFEIGSGYSNNTGLRVKIIWKKPWINSYGHSLENSFSISATEQFVDINYKIPLFNNPLEEYYLCQGGWVYENNIYNLQSQVVMLNIARYWKCIDDDWQRVINLYWYINHCFCKNNFIKDIMIICPGININRVKKRGDMIPYWGNSQRYSVNISANYWKSDIDFIIFKAQNIWIRNFFSKNRIIIKSDLNWVEVNNLSYIIPVFRFFFDKSFGIRGYEYKFVSSFYNSFQYTKSIISTFEYQYNICSKLWSAIFIDFGGLGNNINWKKDFKAGFGMGVRWQLPIGPVRLDIAIPLIGLVRINHNLLHFYVNLGPEL
ncbi:autotransporter assembly complex protein TamA [Candidatus Blochmanniella vafra]|uniref:autotransporter assembly complex protein TamA n=1 Tax=Candidatus Blochmanniella vafra TaxID=251535 RepID=UPI0002E20676|nr:BamA/TamA family outer membrane protein [Candidatus Blochmannia vafer]